MVLLTLTGCCWWYQVAQVSDTSRSRREVCRVDYLVGQEHSVKRGLSRSLHWHYAQRCFLHVTPTNMHHRSP